MLGNGSYRYVEGVDASIVSGGEEDGRLRWVSARLSKNVVEKSAILGCDGANVISSLDMLKMFRGGLVPICPKF